MEKPTTQSTPGESTLVKLESKTALVLRPKLPTSLYVKVEPVAVPVPIGAALKLPPIVPAVGVPTTIPAVLSTLGVPL